MNQLVLTETTAYTVRAAINEWQSNTKGIYSAYSAAQIDCKEAGWYGSDGKVETMINIYTDGEKLYEVKCIGEFTDKAAESKKEMLEKIKAKLTPEEWDFYSQNTK